ncbi:DUF4398 domain-containing protein [Ideonella sp. A 288]|uniref:DUF4398 domain-containing protein n=1 Tax=Ideonella sp. A 288 TaxID=1962181 RepID=UPI001F212FC7|nr:DUF4398 domain-containing protein [Ideonella sp. A 288]
MTPHLSPGWRLLRTATPLMAGLLLLAACASTPPPAEQLAVGRAAVERAGGPASAEAPLELAAARDKISRANTAFAAKDYVLARQVAEQAEADATLAEAQARSVRASRALTEVREGIRQLREGTARP